MPCAHSKSQKNEVNGDRRKNVRVKCNVSNMFRSKLRGICFHMFVRHPLVPSAAGTYHERTLLYGSGYCDVL